jgi:hypothetical protein
MTSARNEQRPGTRTFAETCLGSRTFGCDVSPTAAGTADGPSRRGATAPPHYTAAFFGRDKIRITPDGLRDENGIDELCRRE